MHKAPSVKLAYPQCTYNRIRSPCSKRVRYYGPVTQGVPEKDGYGLFHPSKEVIIKNLQHNLLGNRQVQVWYCYIASLIKAYCRVISLVATVIDLMCWYCQCATKIDKMHEFWGRPLRSYSQLSAHIKVETAQFDKYNDIESALLQVTWKVVNYDEVLWDIW